MRLYIDFNAYRQEALLKQENIPIHVWKSFLRILADFTTEILQYEDIVYIPWRAFIVVRSEIAKFAKGHAIDVVLSSEVSSKLREANVHSYSYAIKQTPLTEKQIREKLASRGFLRRLTDNQRNNLSKLGVLPAGATFSVPGAGKTTEALAYFFLNADSDDRLLVVAPKNAFGAWEEQLAECVPSEKQSFVRLRGGEQSIELKLRDNPKYMLITYQQYPRVKNLIQKLLQNHPTFMFLDESHRIKSGKIGVSAEAILEISYLPKRKLIMSGTPMPQSQKDLIPQLNFLYPEKKVTEEDAIEALQPVYVRTTKGQLGIPEVEHRLITLPMDALQEQIYRTLKSEVKRNLIPVISDASKYSLREIGKRTMKVMQFVSNPALLARDMEFAFDERMGKLLSQNNGPKIEYACGRARQLAAEGKKVIIWSTFVENVELIATRLAELGADYIHGGVDAGDEEDNDTREWKIKEFHNNPNKWVLVANPAAASEGISLHKVCQNAIYIDRSFNAAQYLQSEDRIHRLGLQKHQTPCVEIVECANTIDQVVRKRLQDKVQRMSQALRDTSLNVDVVPYDYEYFGDEGISSEDADEILRYFFGGTDV